MRRAFAPTAGMVAVALAGCGGSGRELILSFSDPVVEAPARSVDIVATSAGPCDSLSRSPHDVIVTLGAVLTRAQAPYPVAPDHDILDQLPTGQPFAIDVAALDTSGHQMARGCANVEIDEDSAQIRVEMRTLPSCPDPPEALDIAISLDTSNTMALASPEGGFIGAIESSLLGPGVFSPETSFTILAHGRGTVVELAPPTSDLSRLHGALEAARSSLGGDSHLFDGVVKTAALARARAVCGRRAAIVLVQAAGDEGSRAVRDEATLGLVSSADDASDDLFTFGISYAPNGFETLDILVPQAVGQVEGAFTAEMANRAHLGAVSALKSLLD